MSSTCLYKPNKWPIMEGKIEQFYIASGLSDKQSVKPICFSSVYGQMKKIFVNYKHYCIASEVPKVLEKFNKFFAVRRSIIDRGHDLTNTLSNKVNQRKEDYTLQQALHQLADSCKYSNIKE